MLLIYSGGLDSTVMLHEFKKVIRLAVNFNYGSKHNKQERRYAEMNAEALGIPLVKIDLPFVNEHFASDLLQSGGEIPEGHYEDLSMKRTVVPFRNGIMLAIAAGLAESSNLETVLYANHIGDHAIYPDCRQEFQDAMSKATQAGTYLQVRIRSPYGRDTKRTIALRGRNFGVDYSKTYSCYKGGDVHCGLCGTCVERKEALKGFDPTVYAEGGE
jgi:7-cyano-7-deazaguanine synthase